MVSLPTGPFLNAKQIYQGLLAMGLTPNAAAGVAGNIYQESHGNPGSTSSAGGGLFGEEVQNGGSVSGGTLAEQLSKLLQYIKANGSVADINAHASDPVAAATYFEQHYERAGIPDLSVRTTAAQWTAEAAKSGNWGSGVQAGSVTPASSGGGGGGGIFNFPREVVAFFKGADDFVKALMWITQPEHWVRILAFIVGIGLLLFAAHAMLAVAEGEPIIPDMPKIMPVPI